MEKPTASLTLHEHIGPRRTVRNTQSSVFLAIKCWLNCLILLTVVIYWTWYRLIYLMLPLLMKPKDITANNYTLSDTITRQRQSDICNSYQSNLCFRIGFSSNDYLISLWLWLIESVPQLFWGLISLTKCWAIFIFFRLVTTFGLMTIHLQLMMMMTPSLIQRWNDTTIWYLYFFFIESCFLIGSLQWQPDFFWVADPISALGLFF